MPRRRATVPSLCPAATLLVAVVAACSSPGASVSASGAGGAPAHPATTGTGASPTSSVAAGVTASSGGALTPTFMVSGVVTDGAKPVGGAIVMQAGGTPSFVTGPDGAYTIELTSAIVGTPTVMAAKVGYRSAGVEFTELPGGPVELALRFAAPPDNTGYAWGDPGEGTTAHDNSTKYCGHCHTTLAKQFQSSGHARAARSPFVQDLYAGVAAAITTQAACTQAGGAWKVGIVPGGNGAVASKCYVGSGVLPELNPGCQGGALACDDPALDAALRPKNFGRCADCHAPAIDGKAGGRNLHEAEGIAFQNGDHCDLCHHVRDVDLSKPPGVGGALVLQRPHEHQSETPGAPVLQVTFGPRPDVSNGFVGASYQPKFSSSELCAGCHEQKQEALVPGTTLDATRWPDGLPAHSAFSEWASSPYKAAGTECQSCHMPPDDTGLKNSLDVTDETNASITFGFIRPKGSIRKHIFRGPTEGSPRLIDNVITAQITGAPTGGNLAVTVTLLADNTGHAIPSDEPMRSLLLLVHADACGSPMKPSGGMTLDDWGGTSVTGVVGAGVTVNGAQLAWPAGAAKAKPGDVVRAVRPTGMYDDYTGIGFFANPMLTPKQKGIEIRTPVGEATVMSVGGGTLGLAQSLSLQAGDIVYVGDALVGPPADGSASFALAGSAGYSFARTMVDPQGNRGVPHYRAVDIVSDNRIAAKSSATTTHSFAIPAGCGAASVNVTVLYRALPLALARPRGWDAKDLVIATATKAVALP